MTKKSVIFIILALAWMGVIFYFSAQDAEESTGQSDGVSYVLGNILYKDFDSWSELRKSEFADSVSSFVRKSAHMTEYGILFFLWFEGLGGLRSDDLSAEQTRKTGKKRFVAAGVPARLAVAFLITVIYAASDEFHQRFVPGRTGKAADVLIDACGALAVCLIVLLVGCIKQRNTNKTGH